MPAKAENLAAEGLEGSAPPSLAKNEKEASKGHFWRFMALFLAVVLLALLGFGFYAANHPLETPAPVSSGQ
jgi:hypothetical protein